MNKKSKKGFSLVELMIVVVIMGILIAVAIPLYGTITDNADRKTCGTNIKSIKSSASNYYASHENSVLIDGDELAKMYDNGEIPCCPIDNTPYNIWINKNTGGAYVVCQNANDSNHKPADIEAQEDKPANLEDYIEINYPTSS